MYFYLYDSYLRDKKYEKVLPAIEARVADLGIKGRVAKLTVLQQLEETIREAIDRGAKTVVVVGNDKTVSGAVNVLANYKAVTLGIVPVGEGNEIAKTLGLPEEEVACDVISNRLIDILDLGRVNEQYFLGRIEMEDGGVSVECDGIYRIKPGKNVEKIIIANMGFWLGRKVNPKDGALDVLIKTGKSKGKGFFSFLKKGRAGADSVFANKFIKVSSTLVDKKDGGTKEKQILIDDVKVIKTPARIDVAPRRLRVIVGKERLF